MICYLAVRIRADRNKQPHEEAMRLNISLVILRTRKGIRNYSGQPGTLRCISSSIGYQAGITVRKAVSSIAVIAYRKGAHMAAYVYANLRALTVKSY
jgi:hypothetical protein